MSQTVAFGGVEAPVNQEREFLTPGFRRLTVKEFTYSSPEEGKTPLVELHFTREGEDSLVEKLWFSGKPTKTGGAPVIYSRIQELVYGLTGDKLTEELNAIEYTKKELDGTSQNYKVADPEQVVKILNKKLKGKSAIFKVGGVQSKDDASKVFANLTFSGFLYFTDKKGELHKYKEERDFTESEYKYAIQKPTVDAPPNNSSVTNSSMLDEF